MLELVVEDGILAFKSCHHSFAVAVRRPGGDGAVWKVTDGRK